MDTENQNDEKNNSLAKDVAVEFTKALAFTAGVWGGLAIVGLAVSEFQSRRAAKKATTTPETVND